MWSFPALLALVFLRVPIGLAMFVTGLVGLILVTDGTNMAFSRLKNETFSTFSSYSLSIVPMFLLMGHFATLGGMSSALFKAAEGFLGHRKGGVAMAAIGACAGFGAICGSSLATAATMGRVALPELRQYGYAGGFSTATLAAGGTLGILIPPSVVLVIYAILTEQNIAKLFLAAFIPGIMAAIGYVIAISIYVRVFPGSAGTRPPVPMKERFRALVAVWPVLLVFVAPSSAGPPASWRGPRWRSASSIRPRVPRTRCATWARSRSPRRAPEPHRACRTTARPSSSRTWPPRAPMRTARPGSCPPPPRASCRPRPPRPWKAGRSRASPTAISACTE